MTNIVHRFGFWLTNQELIDFAKAEGFSNVTFANFDGYAIAAHSNGTFLDNGDDYFHGITMNGQTLRKRDIAMVFPANRQPSPYAAAYRDGNEVAKEFRRKFGKYLPADFDYLGHIGTYQYSVRALS